MQKLNDETHCREEIHHLIGRCSDNSHVVNSSNVLKEDTVDFRRVRRMEHTLLHMHREEVEGVDNIRFLGIHITSDLTWSTHTAYLVTKNLQRLLKGLESPFSF